ncbi:MAG: glycosyltransferase [Chitinophagaceae bacterium]
MKVLMLGGSNSRNSGGVFVSARTLGINLNKYHGVDMHYLMHDDEYSVEDRQHYAPMNLHTYAISGPSNFGFSRDLYSGLQKVKPDVVHTQAIWMYLSYANKKYHRNTSTPYIVSPHGMLDIWQLRQSSIKKKVALALYEMKHLRQADCVHALCKSEYDAIKDFGLTNPVAIIPNGVDLPDTKIEFAHKPYWKTDNKKNLLFLSRIHPKKGIENLLEAWSLAKTKEDNWQLIIAGETKAQDYYRSLNEMAQNSGVGSSVKFIGGQFGDDKINCLRNADAFILPSFSEGLPIAVLEAWAHRLPVLATEYCNLPEGYERNAALRIDTNPDDIASVLKRLFSMNEEERNTIGENGYQLVKEKFTWQKVADDTMQLYNWITGNAEQPSFIKN